MARGSVVKRKLKNGYSYSIVYYLGKKQKWEAVGPNKKEAERRLVKRVSDINHGTYLKPSNKTFQEVSAKWLESKHKRVKPSTFRGYKGDLKNHILPILGNELVVNVDVDQAGMLLNKIRKNKSAATTNNIRLLLLMVLNHAKSLKYIVLNPIEEIKSYPNDHKEMDFLNPSEIKQFLKYSDGNYSMLLLTSILTGMRQGELLALQWGDVDWNGNKVYVKRSLFWMTKQEMGDADERWTFIEPKSKGSKRAIVLSKKLKDALEIYRLTALDNPYDLVFCNSEGRPLDPKNVVARGFNPVLSMAGLRKIRFHDLRHTYASLLINQNESPKFIQNQMGHSSIIITMDTYGHLFPIDNVGVGSRLDAQIFPSNEQDQSHNLKVVV